MHRGVSLNRSTWAGDIEVGWPAGIGMVGSSFRWGSILLYSRQNRVWSTIRSRMTGWLRIGSTTMRPWRATSGPTCVSHASRLFELICIAHEPQIALRHE